MESKKGVPSLEGTGIDLDDGALNQSLGAHLREECYINTKYMRELTEKTHQLVVGGVVANLQDTSALGSALA